MVFHIAVCSPDAALRSGLERQCMEYFARRQDACIVQQLPDADALLRRDTEGERFDLYLIELGAVAAPAGLSAAAELRRRGRWPLRPAHRPTPTVLSGWMPCSICFCRCTSRSFRPCLPAPQSRSTARQ